MAVRFLFFMACAGCVASVTPGPHKGIEATDADTAMQSTGPSTVPSTGGETSRRELVDADAWTVSAPEMDLFSDHRPDEVICDGLGIHTEDSAFEVETTYCNYASLEQVLPVGLPAGAQLEVLFSHGPLNWTEPTEAHAALTFDGRVVWERFIPIPAEGWFYPDDVVLEEAVPKGATVTFHCHNHGSNSYRLYGVQWVTP